MARMAMTRRRLLRDGAGAGAALALGGPLLPTLAEGLERAAGPGYAQGFRSLTDEVRLPDVPVEGRIPGWLRGSLLRNGPALFEIGEQKLNHWFDGLAMLHSFSFSGGRVAYANRFLRSSAYTAWKREGVMKYSEFGTDPIGVDPCRAIFSGVSTLPVLGVIPNANVSLEQLSAALRRTHRAARAGPLRCADAADPGRRRGRCPTDGSGPLIRTATRARRSASRTSWSWCRRPACGC